MFFVAAYRWICMMEIYKCMSDERGCTFMEGRYVLPYSELYETWRLWQGYCVGSISL